MSNKDNRYYDEDEEFEYEDEGGVNIDWGEKLRLLYSKRKLFIISAIITILIVFPITLTMPRIYHVGVKLAPELSGNNMSGGLSSIMKSVGLSGSKNSDGTDDAILPTLYPDLMNSKAFLVSLFDVPVESRDGKIKTTYFNYLAKYQKSSIVSKTMGAVFGTIAKLMPKDEEPTAGPTGGKTKKSNAVDAGKLNKKQNAIAMAIAGKVVCDVDNKTGVISISVMDQDPIICATIADSACNRLQEFITEYRTKKARVEMQNALKQYKQAKVDYETAKEKAEAFNDSNWDLVDQDLLLEKQSLANDMQMRFSNMSTFNQQYLAARSKYESLRPVYTVLDGATVPLKPAGPSRMKPVLLFLFLVLGGEAAYILFFADFKKKLKEVTKEPEQAETPVPETVAEGE